MNILNEILDLEYLISSITSQRSTGNIEFDETDIDLRKKVKEKSI